MFLDMFAIRSCVLNSELPLLSRLHVLEQFNTGYYDYIIATDESSGPEVDTSDESDASETENGRQASKVPAKSGISPAVSDAKKDYNMTRGIDFRGVDAVVNFDCPLTGRAYTHRIGRTARAFAKGTSVTLVSPEEAAGFSAIEAAEKERGVEIKPFTFKLDEIDGFRYRVSDALRAVTKKAVRRARADEIRREIVNSEKLRAYFAENPLDLQALEHDAPSALASFKPHLKHIPDYLMPARARAALQQQHAIGAKNRRVPFRNKAKERTKRKSNPLKSFRRGKVSRILQCLHFCGLTGFVSIEEQSQMNGLLCATSQALLVACSLLLGFRLV